MKWIKKSLFFLVFAVIGAVGGIFIGENFTDLSGVDLIVVLILFIGLGILHVIIHEVGHLFFGLLTGYRFLSFRLFSFCVTHVNEKWKWSKVSVPGTLGQCLMIPPKVEEKGFPFQLYLLGGSLFNVMFSLFALVFVKANPLFVIEFAFIGVLLGVSNLIPQGFNDGRTLLLARQSVENKKLLYIQLASNAELTSGTTFRNLPEEFLTSIAETPHGTYLNDFQSFLQFGYYFELKNLSKMEEILEDLWKKQEDLILPFQLELKKELLFYLLIQERQDERIEELMEDQQLKKYLNLKIVSNYRVQSGIDYYYNKDLASALASIKKGFECENRTANIGEFLVESETLQWLEKQLPSY